MKATDKARAKAKVRYYRLKDARQCVCCASPLEPDDGVKCVICAEQSLSAALRRADRNREEFNARKREGMRANYHANIEHRRAQLRARRLDKKLRGECYDCTDPAAEDNIRCPHHRAKCRRYGAEYWRRKHGHKPRKDAALIPPRQRKRQAAVIVDINRARDAVKGYVPIDKLEQSMRVRVVRALWWCTNDGDWATCGEIFLAANIEDEGASAERNSAAVMLGRLVEYGMAERLGTRNEYRYRITGAGHEEITRFRSGDLRRTARRAA